MKIGLVTPYIYPLPGGVNGHVRYLYENLIARGHDVRIISSTHGPQRSSEGDVIRLGYGFSVPTNGSVGTLTFSHRYPQLVGDMLERERFDLLHFHEPFVPFLSLELLRQSTTVNVATFHAYAGWSPSYEFGKRALGRFARRLHGRIAVSAAARHFIDRYFPGDYKVIPNGVDLHRYEDVEPFARWRDGTPNILFVGRFESRKGLMYLLKAYRALRKDGHDCRLLVAGSGPQEREVRRYIATRRLQGVELLGRVSEEDKARYYATADIYVSPATGQESFGIVLLEAMAAGTAIVCSDIHGYKGVVRRGEQALLVPPRDVDALVDALKQLLVDARLRARLGASGRERAIQYSWENITAKVDDYYGFVIRRLDSQGQLPAGFHAPVPPTARPPTVLAAPSVPAAAPAPVPSPVPAVPVEVPTP
jgi:phosphatidylinositol alpha-mannosyltransferase